VFQTEGGRTECSDEWLRRRMYDTIRYDIYVIKTDKQTTARFKL